MKRLFFGVVCSALICGAAVASPSVYGPTGLIMMPTAETLERGEVNAFINYVDMDEDEVTVFGANAGVGMGIELGLSSFHDGGSATIVNAKWNFLKETSLSPGVAVGAINVAGEDDFSDDINPYIVVSKKLSVPDSSISFSGHLGYLAGDIDEVMIGASADVTPQLEIMADYVDEFAIGARFAVTDDLKLGVSTRDGDLMLSASYKFGFN